MIIFIFYSFMIIGINVERENAMFVLLSKENYF